MIDLVPLWDFLSSLPGLSASRRHWVNAIGPKTFAALERFHVANGQAAVFPHPDDGRPLKIVRLSRGRLAAVCEATGVTEIANIPANDAQCFRMNLSQLRADLAVCLGLIEETEPIRGTARAFSAGAWNVAPATMIPVFLFFAPTHKAAADDIARLVVANQNGFVLVMPVLPSLDGSLWARIKDSRGIVVPMGQIAQCDENGVLAASPAWEKVKASYSQQFLPDLATGPRYALCYAGGVWHLTFDGKTTHVDDTVGAKYIALVLDKPGQHFPASDLARIAEDGLVLKTAQETADATVPLETTAALKTRLRELEEELAEAKEMGNVAQQEELQTEKEKIIEYESKGKGAFGGRRRFPTTKDKARTSVTTAIARTLDSKSIRRDLPEAWGHLKTRIQTGATIYYTPDPSIQWEISMTAR